MMVMLSRFVAAIVMLVAPLAHAGEVEWDPRLTRGTLDNGLAYVLYDSGKATDPFNIRLIVHAGSVDEEEPSGIAHILEHMVFQSNKTHSEGIHRYIQQIGWRQGLQINAVTRESETQYMIRTRPNDALDLSGALKLASDTVFGAQLRQEDWAKERFVILEELRQGNKTADRISRQKKAALRVGSRYVDRSTIGTRETIENASIEDIRAFYDRFYTASNMTLVVSGRIDKASAEAAIKAAFGSAPKRARPDRSYLDLPLKGGLSTGLVQDPAGTSSQTTYAFRLAMPDRTSEAGQLAYLQKYFLTRLIRDAIQAQAPHFENSVDRLGFVAQETTEHRLILAFNASGINHAAALPVLLEAIERVRREGIAKPAFDRLMASARRINDTNVKAAEGRTFAEWEDRIASAVLTGSVVDDPAKRAERTRVLLDRINLEDLEARMREMLSSPDQVLFYQAPGGVSVSVPSVADVMAIRDRLAALPKLPDLPPLSDPKQVAETPIPSWSADATVPQTGSVAEVRNLENPDIREWTLSNGDRVVWLVRDTPDGKIYLSGQSSPGFRNVEFGSTLSQVAVQLWAQSGFRFWTQEEFDRWTEAQPGGSRWSYALKANVLDAAVVATPERLPALLERYAQDIAFGTVRPEAVAEFHRLSAASADQGDDYAQLLYGLGQPERTPASLTVGELQAAASKLLAQPVTWFAVGTAPDDNIRDGFAKTIGAVSRQAVLKTAPALQREGLYAATVEDGDGDRARVQLSFFTPMNWTPETSFLISALNPVAQQALKNELRYKLGGIYTLQFELELDAGSNRAIGTLSFYCAPERAQELTDAAIGVLDRMPEIVRGVDIDRIRADINFAEGSRLDDPNTWLRRLALSYRRYDNAGYLTRMKDLPGRLTQQVFEAEAASVFKTDNLAVLTRLPVERAEP
ncbi:insulinase family protein [Rhizobium sp. RM]|uniref:M16 family metallopeptidase n=1 Tax=Rhizobium sp. RM TaxID=2748079 RepID=UPI00110F1B81|nr:insulinase family protein [Rhizobium sp. RM]NWJ24344.1 insulinase family protein [Rhizobium sp. RM]TMV21107.1 insulinase family protein [Rhizobium sp. Td3]